MYLKPDLQLLHHRNMEAREQRPPVLVKSVAFYPVAVFLHKSKLEVITLVLQ